MYCCLLKDVLSFNEAVLYLQSEMYCIWNLREIIYLPFTCFLDIYIQICLYKRRQLKAESQFLGNSVVLFHIKRSWDTDMFVLRRWGKPEGLALLIFLLQENGRSQHVSMVLSLCCNHEVAALVRICLLRCWFRRQEDFGCYVIFDGLLPRAAAYFAYLNSQMLPVLCWKCRKCAEKLGKNWDLFKKVQSMLSSG